MDIDLTSILTSTAGLIVSGTIAWMTAKIAANKEMKRMQLQWERDDKVSSDDAFSRMAAVVAKHCASGDLQFYRDACEAVASLRAKAYGKSALLLDELYFTLSSGSGPAAVDRALSAVIEQERKSKCHTQK